MDDKNIDRVPSLSLAFLGDAVYAVYMRKYLVERYPYLKPDDLHRKANKLVSARAQAAALHHLKNEGHLTDEEWEIAKKARNKSSATRAKNATIKEYRNASGLEALIGRLDLSGNMERVEALIQEIIEWSEADE